MFFLIEFRLSSFFRTKTTKNEKIAKINKKALIELAKITLRGQITIPIVISKKLMGKDGNKIIFLKKMGLLLWKNPSRLP